MGRMALLQLRVLGFGLLQDGDVGIGVFQSLPVKWSFVGRPRPCRISNDQPAYSGVKCLPRRGGQYAFFPLDAFLFDCPHCSPDVVVVWLDL
jgi:hypothetical protein